MKKSTQKTVNNITDYEVIKTQRLKDEITENRRELERLREKMDRFNQQRLHR